MIIRRHRFLVIAILIFVILCGIWLPTNLTQKSGISRYVILTNFENEAFYDFPLYLTLAFPDNHVPAADFNHMRIKDEVGTEYPYQVENSSVYPSGNIKWAGVWVSADLNEYETKKLNLTFESTAPDYGTFGTISIEGNIIDISTSSLQSVQIKTDRGLCWYDLKDVDSTQLLKVPNSAVDTNSIFDIRAQEADGAIESQPSLRIRYAEHISHPCMVSYISGALFVKVFWRVVDDYGNTHSGWFRVWKDHPWIEFWTDGIAPVTPAYTQAYVGYRIDSDIDQGYSVNNGLLNYVSNNSTTLAMSSVIYQNPTNYYGETNLGGEYGEKYYAESLSDGTLRIHYRYNEATYSNFDGSAINGRLGVPASIILKGASADIASVVGSYFKRPIASYYSPDEDEKTKVETLSLFKRFLTKNEAEFLAGQQNKWNKQLEKAYATLILMDIDVAANLDSFVSLMQAFNPTSSRWNEDVSLWGQSFPNIESSAYWVYRKTGNVTVLSEMKRLLDLMGTYHTTVRDVTTMLEPINARKAVIEMMYQLKELFPDDSNAKLLFEAVSDASYLSNTKEGFNVYYFPKYGIYGQAYNVPKDRSMATLLTTKYIVNMSYLVDKYSFRDLGSWERSYGAIQNSVWSRTEGACQDDLMFGWEHAPQDRIGHASSYAAYISTYLSLPETFTRNGLPLVAGTSTARLSLEYIKSITTSDFIPFASDYWLDYQSGTWELAEGLKGCPIAAGWYSDVGAFEIAVMSYRTAVSG